MRLLTLQVGAPIVPGLRGRAPRALAGLNNNSGFSAMARRRVSKARSESTSARVRTGRREAKGGEAGPALPERLTALERERDALKEELARSKARVRQLEDGQAQVRDRIAWALDSLHNILEGKG